MIERIDHFVLTVCSIEKSCRFYIRVLGLERLDVPGRPTALKFGTQKINLHETGHSFEPKAANPTPGAGDFCLITTWPIEDVIDHLKSHSVVVELGPVGREGAQGAMQSVYFRDPDMNLVEVSRYNSLGT